MPTKQTTASVIVPAYNAETTINKLLDSLINLNFPKDKYEIIIVDNNSTDKTREIVKKYPVTLIEQKKIQSSYTSRNAGIRKAKGEILAFADADCIVDKDWLKNSVKVLRKNPIIDIIAGKVIFLPGKDNVFSYFDRSRHMNQKQHCKNDWCTTANMITRREIFNRIGLFRNYFSSGDKEWTNRAANKGSRLMYVNDIIICHKTRDSFKSLVKKRIRIGYGKAELIRGGRPLLIWWWIFKVLFFENGGWIRKLIKKKISLIRFFKVMILERILRIYELRGFFMGLRNKKKDKICRICH